MFKPNPSAPSIRFLRSWRGREPGAVEHALDYGVCDALVQRRFAEWHEGEPEQQGRKKREPKPAIRS